MNDPEQYLNNNALQRIDTIMTLNSYLHNMNTDITDQTILDIGCGPGVITRDVLAPRLRNYRRLLGVDMSSEMIDYASNNMQHDRISYSVLNIVDSDEVDVTKDTWGKFTKIFSFYCLHWIKDRNSALENIISLLADEGECLLMFIAKCPVFQMYEVLAESPRWSNYMLDSDNFIPVSQNSPNPRRDFIVDLEEVGLDVVRCDILDRSFTFASVDSVRDAMLAVNPFINRIPEDDRPDYINSCLQALSALEPQDANGNSEDESRTYSYQLIVAHSKKPITQDFTPES